MPIARFFIDRPIFAWVLAIIVTLAGAFSITQLPLEQYPSIAPPTIQISASYAGASAATIQNAVVQVIEQQMTGLDNLMYMSSSSSSSGTASIKLTFTSGTNADTAQVQVQDKLQAATARLPTEVQQSGVSVTKSAGDIFMVVGLVSTDGSMSSADVGDYLHSTLEEPLSRLDGIGSVQELGSQYSMRIWLDPHKLQKYSLMPSDVTSAISAQNDDIATGELGGLPAINGQEINATITARSRLTTAEQFRNIVLKSASDGSQVLLSDVARVELGSESYTVSALYNGMPASGLGLELASGANELQVSNEVQAYLDAHASNLPHGVKAVIPHTTTPFVKLSIEEVVKTLIEAIVLVVLIMYLFLQNLRVTLIPTIAVPVVLMGTFGVLAALGYSINTLTMFGLVLAIGMLVDDAIVVVENVERVMREEGLPPREATRKSMDEISSALIGIAMVLSAVLVPMAFFGGTTGIIYRQFSVAVVSAMMLSVLVALTLTPALCATLLKPHDDETYGRQRLFAAFNRGFDRSADRYQRGVASLLKRRRGSMLVYLAIVAAMLFCFSRMPSSFLPPEDQGVLMTMVQLPAGATQERTQRAMKQVQDYFLRQPDVSSVFSVAGFSFGGTGQNAGMMFIRLKDWSERTSANQSAEAIAGKAFRALHGITDASVYVMQPPLVLGLGTTAGFDMQLIDENDVGHDALAKARDQLLANAAKDKLLTQVRYNGLTDTPQFAIHIDDKKAAAMNVASADINTTLSDALGSNYVDDFVDRGRVKKVYVQADAPYRMLPANLDQWYVRNSDSAMVPMSAFTSTSWTYGAPELDRYNGVSSFELVGSAAHGVSSGTAMAEMVRLVGQLPKGVGYAWTGLSYQEQLSGDMAPYLYAVSALFVFLCLAALYESWSIPFSVMLIAPLGILGAAAATWLRGLSNDVYFQVGLLTTIGLTAKNAILIVEFAKQLEEQGEPMMKAIMHAVRLRIRPIVMTSMAFLLGVLPLVISSGAGAAARHAVGTGVFGGTLIGTGLGIFFTPLFYVLVRSLGKSRRATPPAGVSA